ncbi:MAG: extracellular solute-binding protein [Albidovulum sp.]|nr:extracellular solute-binding protein [Albidovulum sp.]
MSKISNNMHRGFRHSKALASISAISFLAWLPLAAVSSAASESEAVIHSHGISTFGNLKYAEDFDHLNYVNPDAPKGGEIAIWGFGTFDSMNPYSRKGRAGSLSSIFFESMLTGTADEVDASYGLLAESIEYPNDRSWTAYNLRPEAKFSDGSPLTADDVLFSYEILLEQGLPSYRAQLAKVVESVAIESPHRIKFTFNTAESTRDYPDMIGGIPIFSRAWFEANEARLDESRLDPALGSGPYVLDSLDINRRIVYRRNPDYWGSDLPINVGRNNFDSIRVEYYADTVSAFEGFKAGSYTFRSENLSKSWATEYNFDALDKGHVIRKTLPDGGIASGQSFVMNLRRPQFQDPRVREAIGLMFNFEWSNKTLFYDLYARIHSFWENSYLAATGLPGADELELLEPLRGQIPDEVFAEPAVMSPASGIRQTDRANLRKASELLEAAGWTVDGDGVLRNAEGESLRVEFLESSPAFDRIILPFVENLKRLGIEAIHSRVDYAQYTERTRNHDFDIITDSLGGNYVPGTGLRQFFGSETADTSVFNTAGLKDPAVDTLIDHVLAAKSQEELNTAVRALDRVLRALRFWIPQWYKNVHTVAYYNIFEHPDPEKMPPLALGNLDFWWYNEEKAESLRAAGAI